MCKSVKNRFRFPQLFRDSLFSTSPWSGHGLPGVEPPYDFVNAHEMTTFAVMPRSRSQLVQLVKCMDGSYEVFIVGACDVDQWLSQKP